MLTTIRSEKCMADSHSPSAGGKPKSEAWEYSPAIVEAGSKLELESKVPALDLLEKGGTSGLLESFANSASSKSDC